MVDQLLQRAASRAAVPRRRLLLPLLVLLMLAPQVAADPVGQLGFGTEMAARGLWSEALFRFRQAEQDTPNDPRILNNIAVSLEALGLYEEALDTYRRAVEAGPSVELAKRNYARFVEFYQAYRGGEDEEEDGADEAAADVTAGGDADEAEPVGEIEEASDEEPATQPAEEDDEV